MKNLIIINAGNFGREVLTWARQACEHGSKWRIKGFLDNRIDILNNFKSYPPIISSPDRYEPEPYDIFISALGNPVDQKKYSGIILDRGGTFTNIVHPSVVMGENVKVGQGVILCPHVVVSSDVTIGNFVCINFFASAGHDVTIGDYSVISPRASLSGKVTLEESTFIGTGAVILPNVKVAERSIVGAGSVVLSNVQPDCTVLGNPARVIYRKDKSD
jgi:sugar O-acyltransferase (sialic acid O-acetyltransferase NeuD family)